MEQQRKPQNIFELINQNIVDMSKDIVVLFEKVNAIYNALYPASEPNASGAEDEEQ